MDAGVFLQKFGQLVNGPSAINKLRQVALQLAIDGRLLDSDSGRWTKDKLGNIVTFEYGKSLPVKSRHPGVVPVYGSNGVTGYHNEALIETPAIVIGRKGSSGALNIATQPFWATDVTYYSIPPESIDLNFFYLMLSSLNLPALSRGIKPGLNRNDAYALDVSYPKLEVQREIIIKFEKLMLLCDELEAKQQEKENLKAKAVVSTLHHITVQGANMTLDGCISILSKKFNDWFNNVETIKQLRNTILELAAQGRLVPQCSYEKPAKGLIQEALNEKKRLHEKRVIKNTGNKPQAPKSNLPYPLPKGWEFTSYGDFFQFIDYRGKTPPKVDRGIPLITAKNIKKGFISREPREFITKDTYTKWMTRGFPQVGDILITTEAPLGNAAVVDLDKFALAQRSICLAPYARSAVDTKFFLYFILSPTGQEALSSKSSGVTATGIKAARLKELNIPVPPTDEQKRIVAKLDELMALCDQLEKQSCQVSTHSEHLFDALLSQLIVDTNKNSTEDA